VPRSADVTSRWSIVVGGEDLVPWSFKWIRRVLDGTDPDVLAAADERAAKLLARAAFQRARELEQGTLDKRRRILGDDHLDSLASVNDLAR
jgi:hypothetical protein